MMGSAGTAKDIHIVVAKPVVVVVVVVWVVVVVGLVVAAVGAGVGAAVGSRWCYFFDDFSMLTSSGTISFLLSGRLQGVQSA